MPDPISNFLRKYFSFSRHEIRGLYFLIPVTVLIIFLPRFLKHILVNDFDDSAEDKKLLESWREETLAKITSDTQSIKIVVRHFNPNKLSAKEWIDLGFNEKIANRILNYRLKGGTFKKKEDLLKIYDINQRLVKEYYNYIIIPQPEKRSVVASLPPTRSIKTKKSFIKFDLNRADTTQLMTINGIGPYWSKRIVRYRTQLGGFMSPNQLYEIYGMEESLADLVLDHTLFEKLTLQKISINQDSIKLLAKHPYVSYKTAKAIINYRKQHGDFDKVLQVKKIVSIPDSVYQKMSPYLKVSE